MEDIKKIQEFFSKPLNEEKEPLDIIDLAKVVKAVQQTGHPVTVLLVPKFNEIEVITGMNAPDDMLFDLSNAVDSLGYGRNDIIIAGDSSNLSRREYSDIRRVNGGAKDYFEESVNEVKTYKKGDKLKIKLKNGKKFDVIFDVYANQKGVAFGKFKDGSGEYNTKPFPLDSIVVNEATKDEETEFHKKLDTLVHDTFGKRKGELEEADLNDPVLMKMRAAKDKLAKMKANQPKKSINPNYKAVKNASKIAFLKKEREQLMRDMEQEAEPEGGPIADEYGSKLNRIDKAIAKLQGRKEMTYDQAIAEGEDKMPTQDQVDRFFELTQNETHYLNSKPVAGQEATFNLMKVEPWDEYDLSNWNSLVRKAKAKGKPIAEASRARVSMPRFKKDKNNPNFLNVYIDYDLGPGGSSIALGKETMAGQIRRESAAEAMRLAGDVARDLEAEYDLEDIDIQDLENGKIRIFAVSDDFINMNPNMLGEIKESLNPEVSNAVSRFIKAMAKRYDYSEQDAVYAIMAALKQRDFDSVNEVSLTENNLIREFEDNGPEENAFDAELMATANGIAATLGKELKAQKGDKKQLDEALVTSIIAGVLTANTLIGFISKMTAKLLKKLNFKKGEDIAEKIHHWAHDNEVAFQAPIKRVLKFFIKDEKVLSLTTKAIYAIVVGSMAAGYGAEAVNGLSKADWFKGSLSALKSVAKSDEAIANAYPAIKALFA